MQDIGGSFYIVLPTTIMLVLLQGKEKKTIFQTLGLTKWKMIIRTEAKRWSQSRWNSRWFQLPTADYNRLYIFTLQCQLLHQSFYPPFISSVWSKHIIIHLQTTSPLSSEGSKPSVDKMMQGFSLQDRPEKNEVPLTRFMVAALLRYASANSDASSHMASRTTGYNLPFFFLNESQAPIQPWILHYHRMQLMRGNACILIILLHLVHGSNFYSAKRSLGGERLSYLGFCSRACLAGFLAHLPLACWSWMNPRHQKMPGILTVHLLRLLMVM